MAILKLAQFQFSLNKSEKSDLPSSQLAPVSHTTGNWSSTLNASQTGYIAPTPVNSQTVAWNAALHS